jgi:hypothetical protein
MKIVIGVTRKHVGEGFREDRDFADEIHILAKGEREVNNLTKSLKEIRKVLNKFPFKAYQIPHEEHVKLKNKFGESVFNMAAYQYKLIMVTEAELI